MKDIYVLGSLNMDFTISCDYFPQKGETILSNDMFTNSGGKGANQAVSASKLGGQVKMIGAVGDDEFGKVLTNTLKDYKVDIENVKIVNGTNSGSAFIVCADKDNRIIVEAGSNQKINKSDIDKALENAKKGDIFVTQLEINYDAVKYGLKCAKEKGMTTIFNPAPAFVLEDDIYTFVDVLIVNEVEAEILSGISPDNIDKSKEVYKIFNKKGVKHLIITLGSKGSIYLGDEIKEFSSYDVEVVDTTGAGDTYIGALAYSLSNDVSVVNAIELSSKASSLTVTKKGAQRSMPNMQDIKSTF